MVGVEGYENETLCSASLVEHLEGMISRRGEDFCLEDLAFARMLNFCKFVISNQFRTEPEALNEYGHDDELFAHEDS